MYQVIKRGRIWIGFSAFLVAASVVALLLWGLNFGIDFTGGSLLEVRFANQRPAVSEVNSALEKSDLGSLIVQSVGEDGMILRFQNITEEKHQEVLSKLNDLSGISLATSTASSTVVVGVEEMKYDAVGPVLGNELKSKSVRAVIIVLIAIVLFIAWSFRKVSKQIASWKYGVAAVIALFHDVIITMGVFAVLGHFFNMEINASFVAAILTVLGYSVNDTIVVFDRVRENLPKSNTDFENTVNNSINQTFGRSINTSLTTIITLLAIVIFGGESVRAFALALTIGIGIGTYSSIFLASPILVEWEKYGKKH